MWRYRWKSFIYIVKLHGQRRNLEMLHLSPLLLLRIEGLINKPMQALGKPVWQEKKTCYKSTSLARSDRVSNQFDKRKQNWLVEKFGLRRLQRLEATWAEFSFLQTCYKLTSLAQRPSLEVHLFRLNRFESYYKFTRGKNDWHMLCRERREISLTVLLVNQCHDVTGRSFDRWISRQTGVKSPFNGITNQEAKNKGL